MKRTLLYCLLAMAGMVMHAADFGDARWITASQGEVNVPNTWLAFRRDIQLESVPHEALAQIAADSKYWLWINGRQVVFEGGLKRGPTPRDSYYDVVDIAPFLRKGENKVAVLLWYSGKSGFSHNDSGKSGLLFSVPEIGLRSDASWVSQRMEAFGTCGKPQPNFRLSEASIRYDGRLDIGAWQNESPNEGFRPSAEIGKAGDAPWNELVERPIPQWKNWGMKKVKYTLHPGEKEDTLVASLPYNMHFTPAITAIDNEGGRVIRLESDHLTGGSDISVRGEYITRLGTQTYASLGWMSGEKMLVIVPHGVKIKAMMYRQTGYNTEFAGSFTCDNDFFNTFWLKGQRTLYVNMRDTYMDCPERERAQWWFDATLLMAESFITQDTRSHGLMRKGLLELCNFQRPDDHVLHSPIPGTYNVELPAQMLCTVGTYGLWLYYMNTGDLETVRVAYPHVIDYLNVWGFDETGLTAERHGGWDWGDWGDNRDMRLIFAGWHYMALASAANMAELLGKPVEAKTLRGFMERVKKGYNACWDGTAYRHPTFKGKTDDRVQALAVVSGIAEPEKYNQIAELFRKEKHASPGMEKYVMEALFMMGRGEQAMERCRERFTEMVEDKNNTTLYEGWGIGANGFGGGTTNHAWSGGTLIVIAQYLMGISPTKAGWDMFDICPQPVVFNKASIEVPTVKGMVKMAYEKKQGRIHYTITVPEGTSCRFVPTSHSEARYLTPGTHRLSINL